MATEIFAQRPDCRAVCTCLGRTIHRLGTAPKYIVCDRESIFDCDAFRRWAQRKDIQPPRDGAVGQHRSIAVAERFLLTPKQLIGQLLFLPCLTLARTIDTVAGTGQRADGGDSGPGNRSRVDRDDLMGAG